MLPQRLIESLVGLFLIFAIISLSVLAFQVSGLTSLFPAKSYAVKAAFDDIGGLKIRAPVKVGGVQVGEVSAIDLDPVTFKAVVTMQIQDQFNDIPDDSSAGIFTAGLLGDNYIALSPMYNETFLKEGSEIRTTRSAMVLEKLIGEFMYKIGNSGGNADADGDKGTSANNNGGKNAH